MASLRMVQGVALVGVAALVVRSAVTNYALDVLGYQERHVIAAIPAVRYLWLALIGLVLVAGLVMLQSNRPHPALVATAMSACVLGGGAVLNMGWVDWPNAVASAMTVIALASVVGTTALLVAPRRSVTHAA